MNKGQSLFEVVVAIGISALIIVAVVSLVTNSIRNATFSKNKSLASKYAQDAIEWLRGQRDLNASTFQNNSLITNWCLSDLSWAHSAKCDPTVDFIGDTIFIRDLTFSTPPDPSGKTITYATVTVSWVDSQGTHSVISATEFTDWRER